MKIELSPQQKTVIDVLNKARAMELYAIMQYMNQHYGLYDDDYVRLAREMKKVAIEEMKHAEMFAERIHDICSAMEPTTEADADRPTVRGQEAEEIYGFDAEVESGTMAKYNEFMKLCRENNDSVSATLFEKIIDEEQRHFTYFSDVDTHIRKLGTCFLAEMAGKSEHVA